MTLLHHKYSTVVIIDVLFRNIIFVMLEILQDRHLVNVIREIIYK